MENKLNYTIHNFKTEDNLFLTGILHKPKKTSKKTKETIIIHIHGMCGNLFSNTGQHLTQSANKNNLSTFLINTRGNGIVSSFKTQNSDGTKSYYTAGTAYENFEDSTIDILAAIKHVKTLGYKKFILSGHSTGCQKITHYKLSQKTKNIISLILLAPADDLNLEKQNLQNKFQPTLKHAKQKIKSQALFQTEDFGLLSAKRFYELFKKTSIEGNIFNYTKKLEHLQKIKIPILSLIGKEDHGFLNIEKAANNLKENLTNKLTTIKVINGDHGYSGHEKELELEISKFLQKIINK